jgi:hypothetical protein
MDKRYKTEAAKWVAWGLGQITKEELLTPESKIEPKRQELPKRQPKREIVHTGKLSKEEMAQLLGQDMRAMTGGLPLMHTVPTIIDPKTGKIKL